MLPLTLRVALLAAVQAALRRRTALRGFEITKAKGLHKTAGLCLLTDATQLAAADSMHVCVDANVHSTC
jgi:hypothetical protein